MGFAETQLIIFSIGWSLIHFLWQGTLITALYWLITRSIESIHAKYWTGMSLVLVSLLVPILNNYNSSSAVTTADLINLAPTAVVSYQQLGLESIFFYFINMCLPYFVLFWGLTVLFLSFRLVKSWRDLAAITHDCDPQDSSRLKKYIKNIAIKLDLPTIPALKVSKDVVVPAAYGFLKPTVLLPLSLISQIPQEQLEAIIKHELCHLKRNDFIHNIIQLCADILLFFHPAIRWMNNDIRHIREQCCDQMVLTHQTEPLTYAKALTNIASFSNNLKLKPSVHLGINDGMLLNRVKILLQNKSSQSSLMIFMPIILLIVMTTFLLQPSISESEYDEGRPSLNTITPSLTEKTNNSVVRRYIGQQGFYPTQTRSPSENTHAIEQKVIMETTQVSTQITSNTIDVENIRSYLPDSMLEKNNLQLQAEFDGFETQMTELAVAEPPQYTISEDELLQGMDVNTYVSVESTQPRSITGNNLTANTPELNSFKDNTAIMPQLKKFIEPTYPQHFWFNQIEQDVIASFKIKSNGKAYDISVNSQRNQYVAFEQEVVKAIKKWKFEPESLNHSTLQRTYQQMFSFTISKDVERNCELSSTGSRLKKPMPCNK